MRRLATVLVVSALVATAAFDPPASAQDSESAVEPTPTPRTEPNGSTGIGGTGETITTGDGVEVNLTATLEVTEPPAEPIVFAADVPDVSAPASDSEDGHDASDGDEGRECVEPRSYVDENDVLVDYCARYAYRICGSERVDDVTSGEINNEAPGFYAAFLAETVSHLDAGTFTEVAGLGSISSVNQLLFDNGLTGPDRRDDIPVFSFCGRTTDDGATIDSFDFTSITFDWILGSTDVYDVDGIRRSLFERLQARLALADPQIGAVPDTDTTLVQWPTWLYLRNLLPQEAVFTTNDTDTFRIDLRAQLERLDWYHADTLIASCAADDITIWDPERHDPIDDLPDCHHIFTNRATADLRVEIVYRVEEDVRTAASSGDYPPLEWIDYLGTETLIDLDDVIPNYRVCEVYSLNIADDFDEAAAQARYDQTACTTP